MAELISGEPEKWFKFDTDTEVRLRLFTKSRLRRLGEQARKRAAVLGVSSEDVFDEILGREAVLGWRKIGQADHPGFTVGGEPFPFSAENVKAIMNNLKFSRFVNDYCVDQDRFQDDDDRPVLEAEKND